MTHVNVYLIKEMEIMNFSGFDTCTFPSGHNCSVCDQLFSLKNKKENVLTFYIIVNIK